jgi:hypothetical protein
VFAVKGLLRADAGWMALVRYSPPLSRSARDSPLCWATSGHPASAKSDTKSSALQIFFSINPSLR